MASASLSFSQLSPNVVQTHTGICMAGGALTVSTTVCPSTVLNMCRVPNGATIIDYWLHARTGAAAQTFQIGTSQMPSGIMKVLTACESLTLSSQVVNGPYGTNNQGYWRGPGDGDLLPVRISLSDDVQPANVWLQLRCGEGCSASAYFTFMVFYTMSGLIGHNTIR